MADGPFREIVLRMADGSEYVLGEALIDAVTIEQSVGLDEIPSFRVDITIKAHSYGMTWNVGRPPRDVTPRPASLPGRALELPPAEE